MSNPIVILHGWSDTSRSFKTIANFINTTVAGATVNLYLADWLSMHDDVTYTDLAVAMQRAWLAMGLSQADRSVDLVVHSTGSLVARQWLTQFYAASHNPIQRLVMLAPANFGSHLAHKGRSFFGRAVKGWGQPGFQTGEKILKGLELASSYSANLADADLFASENWYGKGKILATVMVGNTGYSGISAIANEAGSDGTVRIAGANLNCRRLSFQLNEQQELQPASVRFEHSKGQVALAIMDNENHSTVAFKEGGPVNPLTKSLLQQALTVVDADFNVSGDSFIWQQRIDAAQPAIQQTTPQRSQVVCHLHDQFANGIRDYFMEFYRIGKPDKRFEQRFYEKVLCDVHAYGADPSHRALYFNLSEFARLRSDFSLTQLYLSFNAEPHFKPPRQPVGYQSLSPTIAGGMMLREQEFDAVFVPHQTLLLSVQFSRTIDSSVFSLAKA